MKTLIVYYSLEGNTDYAAKIIAGQTGADLLRLYTKKAYSDKGFKKFFWGGKSALMAEKPALQDYDADLSAYDRIVFGFPVWAGNMTPPIRTFIAENAEALKGKSFAAFACQSGAGAPKALLKLKECLGASDFVAEGIFIDPKASRSDDTDAAIQEFCGKL